jgi:hypothetical protein
MTDDRDLRSEAFLYPGQPVETDAPAWLDAVVEGRLIAAILEPIAPLASPDFVECEEVAPGRWAVAQAVTTDADIQTFVAAVRSHAHGGRAAIALSAGSLGAKGPLGDAPHDALRLLSDLGTRRGIVVDSWVHRVLGGPVETVGAGRLLPSPRAPRRWWIGVAAAVALAASIIIGLNLQAPPDPAAGYIYLFAGDGPVVRSAADRPMRHHDVLRVALEGTPGQFVSLVLINSDGQLQIPDRQFLNLKLTAEQPILQTRLAFDGRPGKEQLIGVFAPDPLTDLEEVLSVLNAEGRSGVAALRRRLPTAYLVSAEPIEHAP